jgi:sugar phosphate isomerase/epimerase
MTFPKPRLGLDVYSLRSQGWSAEQLLEWSARLGAEVVHFSEPRFLGDLSDQHLGALRALADRLELDLEVGMGSICALSWWFDPTMGTGEDQLTRMLHIAHRLGSRIVRCFQGGSEDRLQPTESAGATEHQAAFLRLIDETVRVCQAVEPVATSLGIKIAIENHSGDLQSVQLQRLIERAGAHFVGALFDMGNAAWTLEDPVSALELIAPHVLTSGIRDCRAWATLEGSVVEWVPLGEGTVDMPQLAKRFAELCPGKTFELEIITAPPHEFPYRRADFWSAYRDVPAWIFMPYVAWVERGAQKIARSAESEPPLAERELAAVERSMEYAADVLGLGRRARR